MFTILRSLAWLFFCIVNDLIFAYNIFICLFWIILIILSVWGWLVVYSLYVELRDLSKLEDLAHLRVSLILSFLANQTNTFIAWFFLDGNNGIGTCLYKPVISRISPDNTIYGIDNSLRLNSNIQEKSNIRNHWL